jgi:hypothetical protein
MLPKQIDQILDLAQENLELARFERTLIVRMAHIYQRAHKPSDILTLIPKRAPKEFLTNIAPALNHKSSCYRTRALALTYRLMGVQIPLIAEFLIKSQHAIREFIRRYRSGDAIRLLNRPSKSIKKSERKDLKDRLFAIMH